MQIVTQVVRVFSHSIATSPMGAVTLIVLIVFLACLVVGRER